MKPDNGVPVNVTSRSLLSHLKLPFQILQHKYNVEFIYSDQSNQSY